jgi:hypothetical protein
LLLLVWWLSVRLLGLPAFFEFAAGALFLREAAVMLRHARIISTAILARSGQAMQGKISYSHWFNLQLSGLELLTFANFLLIITLVDGSWTFLGGALACTVIGLQHCRMGGRLKSNAGSPPASEWSAKSP